MAWEHSISSTHKWRRYAFQNLCIFHTCCTELSLCSQAFVTSSIWFFLVCKINTKAQGRSGKSSTCSDVRRIRKHMGHCRNVGIHNWSTRHRKEARQCSLAVYSGFAMQLIYHLVYVSFLPQRTSIFRPSKLPTRLNEGCSSSLCPNTELPEIHLLHHSILTTYHTDTVLTSSLFPWCAGYLSGVIQRVKFRKDGVKI